MTSAPAPPPVPAVRHPAGLPPHLAAREDTLVMGILNITADSFSDGGAHLAPADALEHGRRLAAQGAAIIDIGGESTRPGAARVSAEDELARVIPAVRALSAEGICVSVDTMRAVVAEESVKAGAIIINDVSGGLADPAMGTTCARARTRLGEPPVYVAMHWRGHSDVMVARDVYDDVAADTARELGERIDALVADGIERDRIVADPGLGFAKNGASNWEVLARWEQMEAFDLPLLIGASRKRFVQALFTEELAVDRDHATAAISAYSALHGAWCVRVHDVPGSVAAVAVAAALREHA
ncbi:dihydropteroate synthase [Brachybacterium nesterenkovii]|uniref:Dihydropteroate synthase n=1 Tax=Brachybacterium nesterenkovii TaxID=47847 RepID=A0A1X6X0R2_9MICO|nr:dihydropteroate synthase [Brachybacterium nesterenkovii]SLM92025.1 Dihydropteroate synthase [Brachybacterium nesterenkovii]